ncbi:MAG TPA: OstA-like protein [Ignavibacteriaceae bacterium]|nr:OstA-like protein [Ignavibacteriaceae bacterium]
MKLFICLFVALIFSSEVFSQTESNIITVVGRELIGRVENGESIREVRGDVILTQGNVVITCDLAIQYLAQNNAKLIGNVIITQDTVTITTPEGFYYGNEKRAFSDKGVKLDDKKIILTAQIGEYFFNESKALFKNRVKLFDTVSTMTSDLLIYYRAEDRAVSVGNVKIMDSENIIYADSLIHFRNEQKSFAFENVAIKNTSNNSIIYGDHLEDYRLKSYSLIDENPVLIQIDSSKSENDSLLSIDTLIIKSNYMEAYRDSTNKFYAKDSVKILRGDFASLSDNATYYRDDEIITLIKETDSSQTPRMWFENSQLSGDTVNIFLFERKINKMDIFNNSLIVSQNLNFLNRFDQVSGQNLTLHFDDDGLKRTEVFENVLSIYYLYEEDEPNGLIKASSKDAVIEFQEKKVSKVRLYGDPNSEYHPENLVTGKEQTFLLPKYIFFTDKPDKDNLIKTIKKDFNFNR